MIMTKKKKVKFKTSSENVEYDKRLYDGCDQFEVEED